MCKHLHTKDHRLAPALGWSNSTKPQTIAMKHASEEFVAGESNVSPEVCPQEPSMSRISWALNLKAYPPRLNNPCLWPFRAMAWHERGVYMSQIWN